MAYVKHEWKTGDVVSSTKLNEMENGIYNSQEKITETAKLSADLLSEGTNNKLVSAAEKTNWNSKSTVSIPETSTSTTEAKFLKVGDTEYKLATGAGKVWSTINLTKANVLTMIQGGQLVNSFTTEYDATNFKNDYFLCVIDQSANRVGNLTWERDNFNSVYVNCAGISDILPYIAKTLTNAFIQDGFDHNYYSTLVLYAGCASQQDPILSGAGSLDGPNVIYIQDVSQQPWEDLSRDRSENASVEKLEGTIYGDAFVVSITGKPGPEGEVTDRKAFAFVIGSSQLAYWDSTSSSVKWANTESGKFYQVSFDGTGTGEHETLRWLTTPTTIAGKEGVWATELTAAQIQDLLETPTNFGLYGEGLLPIPCYSASMLEDTSKKIKVNCLGIGDKYMSKLFSFNEAFRIEGTAAHLEYIGRPIGYQLNTYTWYEWDEEQQKNVKKTETNGSHVWQSVVDGVPITLTVPDNLDSQGVAHRDRYILEFDMSALTTTRELYRHSFKIAPVTNSEGKYTTEQGWSAGDWVVKAAFQGVNTQLGDNTMDYILFSDQTYQNDSPDWILPCNGRIGKLVVDAEHEGQFKVTTWYELYRIKATYTDSTCESRCLMFEYFDENYDIPKGDDGRFGVIAIHSNNWWRHRGFDFRSKISSIITPQETQVYEVKAVEV